jgi:hypothetical protein
MMPDPILLSELCDEDPAPLPAWVKTAFIAVLIVVGVVAASVVTVDVYSPPAKPGCWQGMEIGSNRPC